ncbi:hypothetical protein [Nocardia farcinica]|uniref:hypothetical protein n=1 Tax=Nocardia farcinica TaxID=37329 RepID=UPI00341AE192
MPDPSRRPTDAQLDQWLAARQAGPLPGNANLFDLVEELRELRARVAELGAPGPAPLADPIRRRGRITSIADLAGDLIAAVVIRLITRRRRTGGPLAGPRSDPDSVPVQLSPGYHSLDGGETWHESRRL